MACKVLATNPTAQLPKRPHPPAKFHYSSWQERSPHPQPGLNKHPSDITSCQLKNSPGLPKSDHKVPGHAGPSGQDVQSWHHPHTQATKAEASEQEGPPLPPLPGSLAPPSLPLCWEAPEPPAPAPALAPAPTPWSLAAASLRADSGPTRTPHHSHCFKSSRHKAMRARGGSETQRPAKTEKGKRRDKGAESRGDRGQGQRKQGGQEPWGKEQAPKGAFSTRATEW